MSCITKILEAKGDKEFIVDGQIAIEGGGTYKGYEYLITFVSHGHRCGYVAISEKHPLYGYDNDYPDLDVHGGVTYFDNPRFEKFTNNNKCTDKWIGFDAAHCYDLTNMETAEKYFGETKWVKFRKENPGDYYEEETAQHRTYQYMENQCKHLIDQLSDMELMKNEDKRF